MKPASFFAPATTASVHAERPPLPNLDGIRGLACLLVVLDHMHLPGVIDTVSALGVGIFFVLSGFLMSYLYGLVPWNARALSRFAIARFARIAPIYWIVISVCIAISYAEPNAEFTQRISGTVEVLRHYFFVGSAGVFWSIPPEVQFYVFFVLLWWAIAHRRQLACVAPVAVLCLALLFTHALWPGITLPHKLSFFLAGTLAGLLPRFGWRERPDRIVLCGLQLAAVVCLIAPLWIYPSSAAFYDASATAFVFAAAIYLLSIPTRGSSFVFAAPLLRRIGQASFSIYLMHALVFHYGMRLLGLTTGRYEAGWIALATAGVVLPMIASRYVEVPLSRLSRRFLEGLFGLARSAARPAPGALARPLKS